MIRRIWPASCLLALMVGISAVGCQSTPKTRAQAEAEGETIDKEADLRIIGDVTTVANAEPIAVFGVGLVINLEGTGSPTPAGGFRNTLEDYLRKRGVTNLQEMFNSKDTSLVFVSAMIPPGARKGDPIDLEVTLPPQSKTTSLRGGYLVETTLHNYESAKRVNPNLERPDFALKGHPLVRGEGPLLVGLSGLAEDAKGERVAGNLKVGRIWSGGRCQIDRPFFLLLNPDQQRTQMAMRVANRLNETFVGVGVVGGEIATAKTKELVSLGVPLQYKHNLPRFLRVARMVPLDVSPTAGHPYWQKLEERLLDPNHCISAALRLEALGSETIPVLRGALDSPYPIVRFAAAESLAYLGHPACAEPLAKLAREQPTLLAFCLTALASLDEPACQNRLQELMADDNPQVRYGAFRGLRVLNERHPLLRTEFLNEAVYLHCVSPNSEPLIHILSGQRPEVVLFGRSPAIVPPFSCLVGSDFTISLRKDDRKVSISRYSVKKGAAQHRQCDLEIDQIIRTLVQMGGTYADVTDFLLQADQCNALTCPLAVDALPKIPEVQELVAIGRDDPQMGQSSAARTQLGAAPNLYTRPAAGAIRPRPHQTTPGLADFDSPRRLDESKATAKRN